MRRRGTVGHATGISKLSEWTSLPIACLRYTAADQTWTLYCHDCNHRFHRDDPNATDTHIEELLNEKSNDPPASFGLMGAARRGKVGRARQLSRIVVDA